MQCTDVMSDPKQSPDLSTRARPAQWPDRAIERGALRISGAVLGGEAGWHVFRDSLGWTHVVLLGKATPGPNWKHTLDVTLMDAASASANPALTAELLAHRLGTEAVGVGLGIVRVAPHHEVVELLNVSLPALVHWDPLEGMSPYEPLVDSLHQLHPNAETEVLRLRRGAAIVGATEGIVEPSAGWDELRAFLGASAVDPLGGDVADAPPMEIDRMMRVSWPERPGPRGLVVLGIPRAFAAVA